MSARDTDVDIDRSAAPGVPASRTPHETLEMHETPSPSRRTVALADDDPSVLAAMAGLFGARGGWEVVGTVGTGDDLVSLVVAERPDAVVSDVYLPAGEAPLFRRLDALEPRPAVVLAISARATPALRRRLRDAGADDLLRKGLDDPVAAVERLLAT